MSSALPRQSSYHHLRHTEQYPQEYRRRLLSVIIRFVYTLSYIPAHFSNCHTPSPSFSECCYYMNGSHACVAEYRRMKSRSGRLSSRIRLPAASLTKYGHRLHQNMEWYRVYAHIVTVATAAGLLFVSVVAGHVNIAIGRSRRHISEEVWYIRRLRLASGISRRPRRHARVTC